MTKQYITEDKRLQNLPVIFAPKIRKKLDLIDDCNQNNIDALAKWYEYIDGLAKYISNPVIAWDNTGKYTHFPNGAVYLHELGFDVKFIGRTNKANQNYVYVFDINIDLQKFDLQISDDSISECYPHDVRPKAISKETLYRIMSEQYERYLYGLF